MLDKISIKTATALGLRLRQARIKAQLTQAMLAARSGVSIRVISRMEQGDTTVTLGRWLKVSGVLGLLNSWDTVLMVPEDPFEQYDREQSEKTDLGRRRVRLKRRR